jgi:hypothetical protein
MSVNDEIAAERLRAEWLRDSGRFPYVASDPDCPDVLRLAALMEEVGEVARILHDGEGDLRAELIQVAGVAASWAEAIR